MAGPGLAGSATTARRVPVALPSAPLLHVRHELGVGLRRNHPVLDLPPGLAEDGPSEIRPAATDVRAARPGPPVGEAIAPAARTGRRRRDGRAGARRALAEDGPSEIRPAATDVREARTARRHRVPPAGWPCGPIGSARSSALRTAGLPVAPAVPAGRVPSPDSAVRVAWSGTVRSRGLSVSNWSRSTAESPRRLGRGPTCRPCRFVPGPFGCRSPSVFRGLRERGRRPARGPGIGPRGVGGPACRREPTAGAEPRGEESRCVV